MNEVPLYTCKGGMDRREGIGGRVDQFKNNYLTQMCNGSEAGSYLRLIDFCIAQLYARE